MTARHARIIALVVIVAAFAPRVLHLKDGQIEKDDRKAKSVSIP